MTTPIITGPGEYRTRCGEKAIIKKYTGPSHAQDKFVWFGRVGAYTWYWSDEGKAMSGYDVHTPDIIGPWVEPVPIGAVFLLWAVSCAAILLWIVIQGGP